MDAGAGGAGGNGGRLDGCEGGGLDGSGGNGGEGNGGGGGYISAVMTMMACFVMSSTPRSLSMPLLSSSHLVSSAASMPLPWPKSASSVANTRTLEA